MIYMKVNGMITTEKDCSLDVLELRVTADKIGKTLSVANKDIMFSISLEPVLKAIEKKELRGNK